MKSHTSITERDFKSFFIKKKLHLTGHKAAVYALSPADTPSTFLSAAGDGLVVKWDINQPDMGTVVAQVKTNIFSLCYLPTLHRVAIGNMFGGVHWVDLKNGQNIANVENHTKGTFALELVGNDLFSGGGGGKVTKWNIETCRPTDSVILTNKSIRSITHSAARNELAVAASDYCIYIVDATSLLLKKAIPNAHDNSVFTVRYSPDNQHLMSGGRDAQLKVWNADNDFEKISEQPAHWFTINAIAFHPNGHYFATASRDKSIRLWDAATFRILKTIDKFRLSGHTHSVNALLWLPHNNWLVSCSDDKTVMAWDCIENDETTVEKLLDKSLR